MSFGTRKAKSKLSYFHVAQKVAEDQDESFDTGRHPGSKSERIMNKFLNSDASITEEEKKTVAKELEKDALAAGEKPAVEGSP